VVVDAACSAGRRKRGLTYFLSMLINNAVTVEPLGPAAGLGITDICRAFDVNVSAIIGLSGALRIGIDSAWCLPVASRSGAAWQNRIRAACPSSRRSAWLPAGIRRQRRP